MKVVVDPNREIAPVDETRPQHPATETLQAYGLGKLDDASAEVVSTHLTDCSDCRFRVAEMAPDTFLGRLRNAQGGLETPAAGSAAPGETLTEMRTPRDATVDLSSSPVMSSTGQIDATSDAINSSEEGSLQPGTRIGYFGDYELLNVLGEGGMGTVYRARQLSLNRVVALKMIKGARFASADEIRRFRNESEAVARLDHPNIVPVFEVGHYENQHYFSMKLIGGESLDKRSAEYPKNPVRAAELVVMTAGAIHHAHQRGILHRDLKLANILIDPEGRPHVTDFGLAKRVEGDSELTRTGAILGTPAYMAPEQASGKRGAVTTATDVYGLGAVLYVLLTGKVPFSGDSVIDTLEQVRERPPEPPRKRNPRVPRDLEVICLKCLEKDPRRRYASADALAEDLRRFLAGEPINARAVGFVERAQLWVRRHPTATALSATSVVALIATIAAGFFVAYNDELKRANRLIDESRQKLETSFASEAEARQQAEAAGMTASEQRVIAVKALDEARNALDLANRFLEGMEIALERLKEPTTTSFPPADTPEFLEVMQNNQLVAAKVAYILEETFEPMMREARLPGLTLASVRELRSKISWEQMMHGDKSREFEAMRRLQGHVNLILGRLLALKIRCYEYNWACAMMKKERRKFLRTGSNAWKLVPDEHIRYSEKAAEAGVEAKALLKLVIDEHPGTAWAERAKRELKTPLGVKWDETFVEPSDLDGHKKSTPIEMDGIRFTEHQSCGGFWPFSLWEKQVLQSMQSEHEHERTAGAINTSE